MNDLKEFLANKMMDRAAQVVIGEKKVNTAERHPWPGTRIVERAHRQRLGGISGPD